MAFPTSPTNGQIYNQYVYDSTKTAWMKVDPGKYFDVGFIYTQYPEEQSPSEKGWYGTWTNVSSNYAGDFFRAEGGEALEFDTGEQGSLFGSHSHIMSVYNASAGSWSTNETFANGYFRTKGTWGNRAMWSSGGAGGSETRPINKTIRIWKRTA